MVNCDEWEDDFDTRDDCLNSINGSLLIIIKIEIFDIIRFIIVNK